MVPVEVAPAALVATTEAAWRCPAQHQEDDLMSANPGEEEVWVHP